MDPLIFILKIREYPQFYQKPCSSAASYGMIAFHIVVVYFVMMSNQSALMWRGDPNTNRNFFMGHSSSSPAGNFYQAFADGTGAGAPVTYSSTVFVYTVEFT